MSIPRWARSASSAGRGTGERGAGLVASLAGVVAFLCILLLAVQVAYGLYARSAVTAAAFDAARVVAGADTGLSAAAVAEAESAARDALGDFGAGVAFEWHLDADVVELHVVADVPSLVPAGVRRPLGIDTIDRTVRVRTERVR